jgi:hypothetical protein
MNYAHKGYKIDNSKSLILLNSQLRDSYTQSKCNGNLKTSRKYDLIY